MKEDLLHRLSNKFDIKPLQMNSLRRFFIVGDGTGDNWLRYFSIDYAILKELFSDSKPYSHLIYDETKFTCLVFCTDYR